MKNNYILERILDLHTPDLILTHQQSEHCHHAAQAAAATETQPPSDYGGLSSRHCQILVI